MPYVQYNDDPLKKRVSAAFSNLCADNTSGKKSLRALDKTLSVFNGANIDAVFALGNFIYPVDTQNAINFEICPGESLSLFNNQLEDIAPIAATDSTYPENYPLGSSGEYIESTGAFGPSGPSSLAPIGSIGPSSIPAYYILADAKSYARGILLYITYSETCADGSDNLIEDQKANLLINRMINDNEVYTQSTTSIPINSFFAHFCNSQTVDPTALINSIVLENLSDSLDSGGYCITVNGLVIYTKSSIDVKSCAC